MWYKRRPTIFLEGQIDVQNAKKNHGYSLQTEGCIKTKGQCSLEGQSDVINCQKILSEHYRFRNIDRH